MRITTYKNYINQDNMNYLVKEKSINYSKLNSLDSPEKVYDIMTNIFHLHEFASEVVYMICVNPKCVPTAVIMISKGTVDSSLVSTREIFIQALLSAASKIILCHNHPSQITLPSQSDIELTTRIKEAGKLLEVELKDHIIIGADSYFSFFEQHLL